MRIKKIKQLKDTVNTKLIEEYIKSNNLTKTKFCKQCKISYSTLMRILNNGDFYITALFNIAKVMNVKVHSLFITERSNSI